MRFWLTMLVLFGLLGVLWVTFFLFVLMPTMLAMIFSGRAAEFICDRLGGWYQRGLNFVFA